jgi:TctA family transporter
MNDLVSRIFDGMKDFRTSLPAFISAAAGFVLFSPELFPYWAVQFSKYAMAGGLFAFGVNAASTQKVKEKAEEKAVELKVVTENMVDQKVQAVTGVTPPPHEEISDPPVA